MIINFPLLMTVTTLLIYLDSSFERQNYCQVRLNLSTNSLQRNSSFVKKTGNGNIIEPKVTTTLHSNKTVGHNIHVTSPTTVSKAHPQVKASLQSGKIETKSARAKVHVQKSQKKPSAKSPVQSKGTQNKPAKLPQTTKQEKRYNPENDISLASLRRSTLTIYSTNKTYVRGECYSNKPPKAVPSVFSIPKNITSKMVIITTTDSLLKKTQNTIISMSILQKDPRVISVVFTVNQNVSRFCSKWGVRSLSTPSSNKYGLPIFRDLLRKAQSSYPGYLITYINSDILISPRAIKVALAMSKSLTPGKYFFGSRVLSANMGSLSAMSILNYQHFLNKAIGVMRHYRSCDVFIFPPEFDFSFLGQVVVGRWYIDNVVMDHIHLNHYDLIDLTHTISVHQGYETSGSKTRLAGEDFNWNKRYLHSKNIEKTFFLYNKLVCYLSVCLVTFSFTLVLSSLFSSGIA